jgi:hypothetical protein
MRETAQQLTQHMKGKAHKSLWALSLGCLTLVIAAGCSRKQPPSEDKEKKPSARPERAMSQSTSKVPESSSDAPQSPNVTALVLPVGLASMPPDKAVESAQLQVQTLLVDGLSNPTSNNPRVRARIFEIWKMFASEFGNKPIPGATPEVLAGQLLPAEIADLSQSNLSFLKLLKSGKISFLIGNDDLYRAAGLYSSGMLAGSFAGDSVTALLGQRANQMPPSVLDLVAYFAIGDGIREIGSGASHNYPTLETLTPYTTAQNPIYRLLALQATAKALPSGVTQPPIEEGKESATINQARVAILRNYVNETDPVIVDKLIEVLAATSNKEAQDTLKVIRDRQANLGASEIAEKADQAIEQVGKLINAQHPNP